MLSFEEQKHVKEFMLRNPLVGTLCASIIITSILTLGYIAIMWCILKDTSNIIADADVLPSAFLIFLWSITIIAIWYYFQLATRDYDYFVDRFAVDASEKYQYILVCVLQSVVVVVAAIFAINASDVSFCIAAISFCGVMDSNLYIVMMLLSLLVFLFYLYALGRIFMSKYV